MTSDPHSLSGAYALGALDAEDRAAYEAHLAHCPDCVEEVRGFRETAARLGAAEEVPAPLHLRQAVLEAAARTAQDRPVVTELSGRRRTAKPTWPARILLAAAALALVVGGVAYGLVQRDQADRLEATQAEITAILAAPDASMVSAPAEGGGTVRLVQSAEMSKAVVVVAGLPLLDDGHDYQMWTQQGGTMHSAGVLPRDEQGSRSAQVMDDVAEVTAVAISVEPEGGSDQPTTDPIVLLKTS